MRKTAVHIKKISLVMVFSALGVAISPYTWFVVLGTKANPTQHVINAILGVLAGPFWAVVAAIFIGTVRNMLGIGTIYAYPGGIPGGIVVGIAYWFLKRLGVSERVRLVAALTESVGTLLIGAPLALFLVALWVGTKSLLDLTTSEGPLLALLTFGAGWALSSIPGSIIGFVVLLNLRRAGISRESLFGEK